MLPILRDGSLVPTPSLPVNRVATLFDRFFNDGFDAPAAAWPGMPLSMWQDEDHVWVEADAPGLTDKDIEVTVHQGELVLRGERKAERRQGGFDTRSYGRFEQRLTLPAAVDADKVDARLKDGVLTLCFPKSEQAKPRRIALRRE